jgi:hypothetical protein
MPESSSLSEKMFKTWHISPELKGLGHEIELNFFDLNGYFRYSELLLVKMVL